MKRALLLLFVTIPGFSWAQVSYRNVPERVMQAFEKSKIFASYDLSDKINPFYVRGDFDGIPAARSVFARWLAKL